MDDNLRMTEDEWRSVVTAAATRPTDSMGLSRDEFTQMARAARKPHREKDFSADDASALKTSLEVAIRLGYGDAEAIGKVVDFINRTRGVSFTVERDLKRPYKTAADFGMASGLARPLAAEPPKLDRTQKQANRAAARDTMRGKGRKRDADVAGCVFVPRPGEPSF
jgi:hypothetical protein